MEKMPAETWKKERVFFSLCMCKTEEDRQYGFQNTMQTGKNNYGITIWVHNIPHTYKNYTGDGELSYARRTMMNFIHGNHKGEWVMMATNSAAVYLYGPYSHTYCISTLAKGVKQHGIIIKTWLKNFPINSYDDIPHSSLPCEKSLRISLWFLVWHDG